MKARYCKLSCLCSVLLACGSETTGNDDSSSTEPAPALDTTESGTNSAPEVQAVGAVGDLKQVMLLFVEDDPTLDLGLGAAENAENVATRLTSTLAAACPTVTVKHERASTVVSADLDNCQLESGVTVSGQATATLSRRELGSSGELSISFTFEQLTLGMLVIDGDVTVTTTNLTSYPLSADVDIAPLGHLHFDGTALLTMAKPLAVTVNGTGEFSSTNSTGAAEVGTNGWTCTSGNPSVLAVGALHRIYGQCHADAGTMSVTKIYSCTKPLRSQTMTQSVTADVLLEWSTATPIDDTVTARLSTTSNGQKKTSEPTSVMLPWSCD